MTIPVDCRRLAEVDFPIAAVSKHAVREKSIRRGHPSTLHGWWARRPLASSRAVLLELLLPDPCDKNCPPAFKTDARDALGNVQKVGPSDEGLRSALLRFIGDFANWDLAANTRYLGVGRALVRAAHPGGPPLVVDPFAGGGSIPLEALRIGCEAFASDLNPVACLILKVLLETMPRHGLELADEVRRVGKEIKEAAERKLAGFYPADPDGARPIAYLWARTVRCEQPDCGAEIPLMRSCWLSRKSHHKRALRYRAVKRNGAPPDIALEIVTPEKDGDVQRGTVNRAKATCPACSVVLGPERVCHQLKDQSGGADVAFDEHGRRVGGARLLAAVTLRQDERSRQYRLATRHDYEAVREAMHQLERVAAEPIDEGLSAFPDEPLPPIGTLGFRVQRYGMLQWGDLFTARQKLTLANMLGHARGAPSPADEISAMAITRFSDDYSSLTRWMDRETPAATFSRNALPILWDFCEVWPFDDASWSVAGSFEWIASAIETSRPPAAGQVQLAHAADSPLPDDAASIWFTDPPYYDAIPYADLSDFFFVWLKRGISREKMLRDPFDPSNPLTPKDCETVQDATRSCDGVAKDRAFFEQAMADAFAEGRRILQPDGIASVVFAHKTTEGWEALLSGMTRGGWTVTGSWPISTERIGRPRSHDSAALATSVHLICRPRSPDAPVGDWADVLRKLPGRVGSWMERLQAEGIRGADLVFACIGPALEIFSRYSKVETAEGQEIELAEYLERVWEVVGRAALSQVLGAEDGDAALEEDARLASLFLWTLQSTSGANNDDHKGRSPDAEEAEAVEDEEQEEGDTTSRGKPKGYALIFDVVRRFAQPLGIHLDDWEDRVIETKKGVVRLLPVFERAKQLFGEHGAHATADRLEAEPAAQLSLFPEMEGEPKPRRGRRRTVITASDEAISGHREATTLDRVHAAMLLQASGRANALRALLETEQQRGPDFLRLANALSALYPREAEEKRLLDAMLLAMPR